LIILLNLKLQNLYKFDKIKQNNIHNTYMSEFIKSNVEDHLKWNKTTIDDLVLNLIQNKIRIRTAESCTGGGIMNAITNIDGSSRIMDLSVLVYSPEIKQKILNVPHELTEEMTIVSRETAESMNTGLCKFAKSLKLLDAHINITITGWIGWAPTKELTNVVYFTLGNSNKTKTFKITVNIGENKQKKKEFIIKRILLEALDF